MLIKDVDYAFISCFFKDWVDFIFQQGEVQLWKEMGKMERQGHKSVLLACIRFIILENQGMTFHYIYLQMITMLISSQ